MRRLSLLLAVAAFMVAGTVAHRAYASGDQVELCLVNASNTPAVFDQTTTYQFGGTTNSFHTRTTYYAGNFVTVDADAVDALLAQGLASWGTPLTDSVISFLGSLTTNPLYQDRYTVFPGGFSITVDYENVDLVVRNADCYWSAAG